MQISADADPVVLAARLDAAWRARTPIPPFSEGAELTTIDGAYATQQAWAATRTAAGERTVGRKIGLTSHAMQQQMGVDEPDFGDLWEATHFPDGVVPLDRFIQPRVEAEIAFLMGEDLEGPGVIADDVLRAAQAAAPAIEIIDSRIENWRIRLVDTIADNASYGGFTCGAWSEELLAADLPAVRLTLSLAGETLVSETGDAVLGSPAIAVAWLANRLSEYGNGIRAGDVVLSGSFGGAVAASAGQEFVLQAEGQQPLTVRFAGSLA